jgi:hypothetical protein
MQRVHGRTVQADFASLAQAREAVRRIRREGLGRVQVDVLTGCVGDRHFAADSLLEPLAGPDTDMVVDALEESPANLLARRPRQGRVLLTVVTREEDVPAVVSVVKDAGGSV